MTTNTASKMKTIEDIALGACTYRAACGMIATTTGRMLTLDGDSVLAAHADEFEAWADTLDAVAHYLKMLAQTGRQEAE